MKRDRTPDHPPSPLAARWRTLARASLGLESPTALERRSHDGTPRPAVLFPDDPAARGGLDDQLPGAWPFRRHACAAGGTRGWELRQIHADPDLAAAQRAILDDLHGGVAAIELRYDPSVRRRLDEPPFADPAPSLAGVTAATLGDLERLLDGVLLEAAPVALDAGAATFGAAAQLVAFAERRRAGGGGAPAAFPPLHFCCDPLGELVRAGELGQGLPAALAELCELARVCDARYPAASAVRIDTAPYHLAGASDAQELALAMLTGLEYVAAMVAGGLPLARALRQMRFRFQLDGEMFSGIAKLRAARELWARLQRALGAPEQDPDPRCCGAAVLEAATAERALTADDPWQNVLRATAATFAGALGGAEVSVAPPFDAARGVPSALALRLARNTQHILRDESGLGRVIDPGGGAYAIEAATDALARAAYAEMQRIERAGGLLGGLLDGTVAAALDAVAAERAREVASGRQPVLGVSVFAPPRQQALRELEPAAERDLVALRRRARAAAPAVPAATFEQALAAAREGAPAYAIGVAGEPLRIAPLPRLPLALLYQRSAAAAEAEVSP